MASMRNNSKPSVFETYIEDDNHQKQVSQVLKKYDLDGDGKLDAAEQQNIGHDMLRMEDIARLQKKLLMFSFGVIVFLCVSNIATGYLAVMLAKDTKVAKDGVMKDTSGGNVKTQAIAPKVNIYESLETGTRRKLQNENDNPDGVVLQGFVDSAGIAAILEGGVARFMTQSGMQACEITKVTRTSVTLFDLETSCGNGTLELLNTGASGRRLEYGLDCGNLCVGVDEILDFFSEDVIASLTMGYNGEEEDPTSFPTTEEPSPTPSVIPTDNFVLPTASSSCQDDPHFTFPDVFSNTPMKCSDIPDMMDAALKTEYCSTESIGDKCPSVCGYCPVSPCQDSVDPDFPCGGTDGIVHCEDVHTDRYFCPETCGICARIADMFD
ncbi:predicted protein [Chaetoceros tenuissimus]|uniref:EF-hand domain-containing protein n=1 Tax=Chaetoceros tenuissimus TaxID=426638 RepID=A0AAD3HFW9_9STRA|nr:predicted protein [Chaetoceros tenuissimus]